MNENRSEYNKGKLIYKSARCKPKQRLISFFYPLLFVITPLVLLILAIQIEGRVFLAIFVIYMFSMTYNLSRLTMYTHVYIYENGMSIPLQHRSPFSRCRKFSDNKKRQFIRWDQIEPFQNRRMQNSYGIVVFTNDEFRPVLRYSNIPKKTFKRMNQAFRQTKRIRVPYKERTKKSEIPPHLVFFIKLLTFPVWIMIWVLKYLFKDKDGKKSDPNQ